MSGGYNILKIPISKEKSVFYYYRQYKEKTDKAAAGGKDGEGSLVSIPEERSLYICHFSREIDVQTIEKYFGLVGKIKQVHTGVFKNKSNNKKKRRILYFAIVVYKKSEDAQNML